MKKFLSRASAFSFLVVVVAGLSGCFGGNSDSSADCPINVINFSPVSGSVGTLVTVTGENLGGVDGIVGFSGAAATPMPGSTETPP